MLSRLAFQPGLWPRLSSTSSSLLKLMFGHESLTNAPQFWLCGRPLFSVFFFHFCGKWKRRELRRSYVKAAQHEKPKAGSFNSFCTFVSLLLCESTDYGSGRICVSDASNTQRIRTRQQSLLGTPCGDVLRHPINALISPSLLIQMQFERPRSRAGIQFCFSGIIKINPYR